MSGFMFKLQFDDIYVTCGEGTHSVILSYFV